MYNFIVLLLFLTVNSVHIRTKLKPIIGQFITVDSYNKKVEVYNPFNKTVVLSFSCGSDTEDVVISIRPFTRNIVNIQADIPIDNCFFLGWSLDAK